MLCNDVTNIVKNSVFKVFSSFRLQSSSRFVKTYIASGFGGLGVACWPLVPKFACSNPAENVGFLGRKKSSARLPSEGK